MNKKVVLGERGREGKKKKVVLKKQLFLVNKELFLCFHLKKEGSLTYYNVDLEDIVLREISQSQKDEYRVSPLT